jgi:hypothetical protein
MRGNFPIERESWKQFGFGLCLMIPWPLGASLLQPLDELSKYLIYLVGLFWNLAWDPITKIQENLSPVGIDMFTLTLIGTLVLMWLTVAALPLLGRWPGKQIIGLWSMQCTYAGSQAISGYFYAKSFLIP